MVDRKGVIIYFQNKKVIKAIEKLNINITYINEAGKYLTGYCDSKDLQEIKKELKKDKLIRRIEESLIEMPSIGI